MMGHGFFCATFTTSPGIFFGLIGQRFCWRYNHDTISETIGHSFAEKNSTVLETQCFYCRGWGWGIKIT